jgi:uncharacterized protein (TIGR03435 family)
MIRILLGATLSLCGSMCAQTSDSVKFEVASIKPSKAAPGSGGVSARSGLLRSVNVTLKRSIMGAYEIGPNQIFGGPDWLDTERFDITAKADEPVGDHALMAMLQTLMAERFKLAIHRETRPIQAYVLEIGRNGSKLKKGDGGVSSTDNGRGNLLVKNTTLDRFAEVLSRQMDLPVVNRTGLDGAFNVELRWTPENRQAKPGDAPPDGPSIFTAIQEQLGLRLRAEKVPIEVLVIDHAEKPTEN